MSYRKLDIVESGERVRQTRREGRKTFSDSNQRQNIETISWELTYAVREREKRERKGWLKGRKKKFFFAVLIRTRISLSQFGACF